jgi:WD40 repeat protein
VARLWEISDLGGNELMAFSSQEMGGGVGGVAFSPSGDRILTAQCIDAAIKIWDLTIDGSAEWRNLPANPAGLPGLAYPSDGPLVASSGEGLVTAWDPETGRLLSTIDHESDLVFGVDVNTDGSLAASAGQDGVRVWETASGTLRFHLTPELLGSEMWSQAVAWSPVDDLLATGSVDGPARIVDDTGATIKVLDHVPGSGVFAVAFSPDGRLLATAAKQIPFTRWDPALHRVTIWDWKRGTVVATIPTSSLGLAFDGSGERLATSSYEDGLARIWDVVTGTLLATLAGHAGGVVDVSWHPDATLDQLATAGADGTVRLWNGSTGVAQLVLRGHSSGIWQVAFGPGGSRLASTGGDGTVRVWALEIDDLIAIAEGKLTRDLTPAECLEFLHRAACP